MIDCFMYVTQDIYKVRRFGKVIEELNLRTKRALI